MLNEKTFRADFYNMRMSGARPDEFIAHVVSKNNFTNERLVQQMLGIMVQRLDVAFSEGEFKEATMMLDTTCVMLNMNIKS